MYRDESNPTNAKYNQTMTKKLHKYKDKIIRYDYFRKRSDDSQIKGSYRSANQLITELPTMYKTITEQTDLVIMEKDPVPSDINTMVFTGLNGRTKSPLMSALASIINSDARYRTSSLRRLIYPHRYNQPCLSKSNVYHVKLVVNGMRRCFPVDGIVNQSVFYTKKKEVYPFLIQKALTRIYPLDRLNAVDPNLIVYRLIGWIPETLNYMEIGDPKSAFDKLLQNMISFAIIISFDYKDQVLPLLDLKIDSKTNKRTLVTLMTGKKDPSSVINTQVLGRRVQ